MTALLAALLVSALPALGLDRLTAARQEMLEKMADYRAQLEKVVPLEEARLRRLGDTHSKRKELFTQGLISRRELEESERAVAEVERRIEEVRRQLAEADELSAEVRLALEHDAKTSRPAADGAVVRYAGSARWSPSKVDTIERFFSSRFGEPLPVSARGQTPLHERMGFAHRQAVDVALHPDSAPGRALLEYLRRAGVPFIAFRAAIPGSATGAHIHIGPPSQRIEPAAE